MAVSYKRLFKMLIDKDIKKMDFFRNSNEKWTTAINGKKKTPATMTAAGA